MTPFPIAYQYKKAAMIPKRQWTTGAFFSLLSIVVGMFFIGYVGWTTIGAYTVTILSIPESDTFLRPVSGETLGVSEELVWIRGVEVRKTSDGFPAFTTAYRPATSPVESFTIDIAALGIFDAEVKANSEEFNKHLGHFPGSALPGGIGNVFISGHSVLPQFFNPDDYKTIFSTLPNIQLGDTVQATMAGVRYEYHVIKKTIVDPSDISVLLPPNPYGKYVTLMTCVPPGLNTKRLVVLAQLEEGGDDELLGD